MNFIALSQIINTNILLSKASNLFAVEPHPFQAHPLRMTIGIISLLLAVVLTVCRIVYNSIKKSVKEKSYGQEPSPDAPIASFKHRDGSVIKDSTPFWGRFVPSYKGGMSTAGNTNFSKEMPASYKETWGNSKRYGHFIFNVFFPEYKGGHSKARSANISKEMPASYKETWGNQKRYGHFIFNVFFPEYKGGHSKARSANISKEMPASYKETWGNQKRYGHFIFNMFFPEYKGGHSKARSANLGMPNPDSYKSAPASRHKKYTHILNIFSYHGGVITKVNEVETLKEPTSHKGKRLLSKLYMGEWQPDAMVPSYKGGFSAADNAELSDVLPTSHKNPYRFTLRYGKEPNQMVSPSYKGGFSKARNKVFKMRVPQSFRGRFYGQSLTSKTWCIPVDSYKGGYGVAGVGKPLQELPLSYKEPWGSKYRYLGDNAGFLPIRMDGSPNPYNKPVIEYPPSYKEPWGLQRRYKNNSGIINKIPIRMDGSPRPEFKNYVELPRSYKEPWGSAKRYGKKIQPVQFSSYKGGNNLNASAPWQNPETGEIYVTHMSDKQRYGNKRYGGKLYAHRSPAYFAHLSQQDEYYSGDEVIIKRNNIEV